MHCYWNLLPSIEKNREKKERERKRRWRRIQEWCIPCRIRCGGDRNRWYGALEACVLIPPRSYPINGCSISLVGRTRTASAIPAVLHPSRSRSISITISVDRAFFHSSIQNQEESLKSDIPVRKPVACFSDLINTGYFFSYKAFTLLPCFKGGHKFQNFSC